MDRSKWEYKKLGEVATFINGDRGVNYPSQTDFVEVGIPFVNAGHLTNNKVDFSSMNYIKREKYDKLGSGKIQKGDILFCLRGSLGKKAIADNLEEGAIASSLVIIRPSKLNTYFLSYYLESPSIKREILRSNNGSSQPNLSAKSVSRFAIPIPPISDQQRIVAELDCLNEMIAVKQEQLKEFDKLAQSIFYDMFGDPVANDKQWDMVSLENIATLINGRAYKQDELLSEGKYKVIRVGNFFSNNDYYYSNLELEDNKYCDSGDLLYTWSASFGARIWDGGKVIYHYHIWKIDYQADKVDKLYLCYLLNLLTERFKEDVHGVTMVHLTKAGMEKNPVILPPLALQQQFAEKISAIEAQKELVKQSIAETQKLLDYTMDYYFNE